MNKPKVLLLGMSYPDVPAVIAREGKKGRKVINGEASIGSAVECVEKGVLTEMDGRDLARCIATEVTQGVEAFTVSQEAAIYRHDKHCQGSFNRTDFVKKNDETIW